MAIFGVMLAGGGGVRLGGVDKAQLKLGNTNLATLVYNQIFPQSDFLSITFAPDSERSSLPENVARLTDKFDPQIGPLGGIYAGYEWAKSLGAKDQNDYLLIVPIDSPLFPSDFVQQAVPLMQISDVVVARYGDQEYPTCSLWRCGAASRIGATRSGARNNSVRGYLDKLEVGYIDFLSSHPENPFKNVNKISDLIKLSARTT
ncbi:NTP transferase domain-containing protein [uncultured Maritalea sp.]|uniref:NTP transferase domain-containing protein n=1 Tax=uncultured Maritalea sp. TaxID=757249 RepID=UPI002613FCAB|nr:NTP transferase domain-containing protein [uncultured Maritalea sp.]